MQAVETFDIFLILQDATKWFNQFFNFKIHDVQAHSFDIYNAFYHEKENISSLEY